VDPGRDEIEVDPRDVALLATYVPRWLLRRLQEDPRPPEQPKADPVRGAVLAMDLVGFTDLGERLATESPAGAERLRAVLESCFEHIVAAVHEHGGDVLSFSGDGLLALWEGRANRPLSRQIDAAAHCARAMHERIGRHEPLPGLHVGLKVALGVGEMVLAHLGGLLGRWELLPAGEPLAQLQRAVRLARAGDTIVSPEAWRHLEAVVLAERIAEGHRRLLPDGPWPPPPRHGTRTVQVKLEMEAALRAYIPAAVQTRLQHVHPLWLADLRRVSVGFVQLPRLTHETSLTRGQEVLSTIQRIVYRHEGSLNKISVDDKGASVVVAFGLPPLPHANDPVRALRAALELHAALRAIAVDSAIGVSSGRAYCGTVGARDRREYTMIGRAVNLAARLMELADDGVLCDAATARAARDAVRCEPVVGERWQRDRLELSTVYRPRGDRARSPARRAAIVGRRAERRWLQARCDRLRAGKGGVLVLRGEAGIGKSWLLEDLRRRARRSGVRLLEGSGSSIERQTAYLAWRSVFEALLELPRGDEADLARHVLDRMGSHMRMRALASLLEVVLPIRLPESDLSAQMRGEVRADNTRELLVWLLSRAASTGPLLILLEDAHWFDSASWKLAQQVARDVPSALLALAVRPEADGATGYRTLVDHSGAEILEIEGLSSTETAELMARRLGVAELSRDVTRLVMRKTDGHPLFSEQLALSMVDTGLLKIQGESGVPGVGLERRADAATPDTVQGAIVGRIDRLTPSERMVLRVGSAIGPEFERRLLAAILPQRVAPGRLDADLARLVQLDILHPVSHVGEDRFAFKHELVRDVTYDGLLYAQRVELHTAIARRLEREGELRGSALLADHWLAAGRPKRAIEPLIRAATEAVRTYANAEARMLLDRALELVRDEVVDLRHDRLALLHRLAATTHLALGDLVEVREHLRAALSLMGWPLPAGRLRLLSGVALQVIEQGLRRAGIAVGGGDPARDADARVLEAARAYEMLAEVFYHENDSLASLHAILRNLNLCERVPGSPERARAYANTCVGAGYIPLHALSRYYSRRARRLARKAGEEASLAHVLARTGMVAVSVGDWATARPSFDEAISLARRLGARRLLGECRVIASHISYFRADYARLREESAALCAEGLRESDVQHQYWGLFWEGHGALRQGQLDEALALLDRSLALLHARIDDGGVIIAQGARSQVLLQQGELERARAVAEELDARIGRSRPTSHSFFEGYAAGAEIWLALARGGASAARRRAHLGRASQSLQRLERYARIFPIGRPRAALWRGQLLLERGHVRSARRVWRRGLRGAEAMHMPFEQARLHQALATCPHGRPAARDRHGADAARLLECIGAGREELLA
jgi:class 3 adenylate cyclase/tetratricopeptide (TPR) repeat protein